jgi:hypothetical protein
VGAKQSFTGELHSRYLQLPGVRQELHAESHYAVRYLHPYAGKAPDNESQPVCDILVEPMDPLAPVVVPKSVWINGVEVSGVMDIRTTATPGKPVEIQMTLHPTSYTVGNPLGPGLDDEEGLPVVGERRLAMGEAMRRVRERRAKQNGG